MTRTEIIETMARAAFDSMFLPGERGLFDSDAWLAARYRDTAEAQLTALEAKGMVVVPRKAPYYPAMLAASPTRTPEQGEGST